MTAKELIRHPLDPATDEDALDELCAQWCPHLIKPASNPYCQTFEVPLKLTRDFYIMRCSECLNYDLEEVCTSRP